MYSVIVADDEEELRQAIVKLVDWEKIGFRVVAEASNGADALELVEKLKPDLLLTDIRMPFVSGIELARQVREVCPVTHIAYLSGYDDFSYAQKAIAYNIISYMLKPISVDELTQELTAIKKKMDDWFRDFSAPQKRELAGAKEFAMGLLLDSFSTRDDVDRAAYLHSQAALCGLIDEEQACLAYAVMLVAAFDKNKKSCLLPEHVHSVESILQKYVRNVSFYAGGKVVSLLIGTEKQLGKYLHILSSEITQNVERIMDLSCSIGISRITTRLIDCNAAYQEAFSAMRYSKKQSSSVHYITDEEHERILGTRALIDAVDDIEGLIRSGNKTDTIQYLDILLEDISKTNGQQQKLSFLLIQLFSVVFKILYALSDGKDAQVQADPILMLMSLPAGTETETRERIKEICLQATEFVSGQRKKSSVVICEKALELIEKEFADPLLSLVSVSESINVSPNYLSALIKKQTGKTFMTLLTNKRCESAKALLMGSNLKIREIAEKCGYNDQHYFSFCFKKYSGVSPNSLRHKEE